MEKGWIKLHRKLQDHYLWSDKPFTKGQAWIDILMTCNHSSNKLMFGDKIFICECGESMDSLETYARKWGWSKSKVRRFLKFLESDTMIETIPNTKTTHLRVINYGSYQHKRNASETQVKQKRNASETQVAPNNNSKNVNNVIMGKKEYPAKYEELAELFYDYVYNIHQQPRDYESKKQKYINEGAEEIDKLIRIDKYEYDYVKEVLGFAVQDSFWSKNVLSLKGLRRTNSNSGRKKFDNLTMAMKNNSNYSAVNTTQEEIETILKGVVK